MYAAATRDPVMSCTRFLFVFLLFVPAGCWASDATEALHIGIFPRRPAAETRAMFRPLAEFLSARLGVEVILETPPDYLSFWSAIEQGRFDLVHYNQYHYVRAHDQFGHQLIAKNEEFGRAEIRSSILVRNSGPYRSLRDLRDHKILFGGGNSAMVSYVMAVDMLRSAGLKDGDYITQFAQNPVKALIALHYMQGDAAAASDVVTSLPILTRTLGENRFRVLAQSGPVPHLPWAIAEGVDAQRAQSIRQALLGLNDSGEGQRILAAMQLTAVRPATDAEYDVVRVIVERVLGEKYCQEAD